MKKAANEVPRRVYKRRFLLPPRKKGQKMRKLGTKMEGEEKEEGESAAEAAQFASE